MALNFPDSPGIGSVFTDTTSGFSWEWTGAVWKSYTPAAAQNIKNLDDISGSFDNSETTFNLTIGGVTYYPRTANLLQISLGGVIQEPDTDYTVDFTAGTITFTTAPNVGLDFFGVVRGTAIAIDYANNGNVQNKQNYTATAGQTAFTFSAGYNSGYLNVYRNGVKLRSTDFTETSSTIFTLTTPAQENDEIEAIGYVVASIVTTQGNFTNLNITGIVTAGSFVGDGSGLTGVASTDNIQTATPAKFLNDVSITGITTIGSSNGIGTVTIGVGTEALYVDGNARVIGILTVGRSSITLDGSNNSINVGTAVTIIGSTGAIQATSFVGDGSGLSGAGATLDDDTSTASDMYPVFSSATTGSLTTAKVSSTKLTYNPSTGKLTSTIVNSSSDENLKKDITTIGGALDKINQLRGVDFTWKETEQKGKGVIAQELQEVFPELVSEEPNGNLSVNYTGLIAVLIEAIKELSDR